MPAPSPTARSRRRALRPLAVSPALGPSPLFPSLGQNRLAPGTLPPLRENTLASLAAAAAAGASFVEFDVQVTADGHAVLWHDAAAVVAGAGGVPTATPVAGLTLAEFRGLNSGGELGQPHRLLRRAAGTTAPTSHLPWAVASDDALPTLAEALARLPAGLGLNIEVKAGAAEPGSLGPKEVSRVLAGVLAALDSAPGRALARRRLALSSFDAALVAGLAAAQGLPVLLLSDDAGRGAQAAAAAAGAAGLVYEASALAAAPAAAERAARAGLHVLTYGPSNDDPAFVAASACRGVGGVIVDDVARVVGGLGGEGRAPEAAAAA